MVANLLAAMVGVLFFFICTKKGLPGISDWNLSKYWNERQRKRFKGKSVFRQDVKTVFWVCNVCV